MPRSAYRVTVDEIAETLAQCNARQQPLRIVGGGTHHAMGYAVESPHAVLDTRELNQIVEDAAADLTIAVQAGVTVQQLSQTLDAHGTFVPLDVPQRGRATVGGTLASGWLGPRRHAYGRARDFVIGSTVVLADGTIARAGGMVVKNVSGYDMSRLYVGSFGTLAVYAQVNFKTIALPGAARAFVMALPDNTLERAIDVMTTLAVTPSAAWWIRGFRSEIDGDDGDDGRLVVLLECSQASMERATREVRSALGKAGVPSTTVLSDNARAVLARCLDASTSELGERSITYRLLGFPEEIAARGAVLAQRCEHFELRCDILADVMNGDLFVRVSDLDSTRFGTKIQIFDDALHDEWPAAVVVAGAHAKRDALDLFGRVPETIDVMQSLKKRFDPHRILNRGRFLPGL